MITNNSSDFIFVVPPSRLSDSPALGVSLLNAQLKRNNFNSKVIYSNLLFAKYFGLSFQLLASNGAVHEAIELIYSYLLFERSEKSFDELLQHMTDLGLQYLIPASKDKFPQFVKDLAREIYNYTNDLLIEVLKHNPKIVGVSSNMKENTFCLYFFHLLKEKNTDILTIVGGANCTGDMGKALLESFTQLDYVAQGEGDYSMLEFVRQVTTLGKPGYIDGILSREQVLPQSSNKGFTMVWDMDSLPEPEFSDYFLQASQLFKKRLVRSKFSTIYMETSRGCWWRSKASACSFCALDSENSKFRTKSFDKVINELTSLNDKFHPRVITFVDNLPDPEVFSKLLDKLAQDPIADKLFIETVGSLSRELVKKMSKARFTQVQPGIESFDEYDLRKMGKPTNPEKNIQTLKWFSEFGISADWNYLIGVPDEIEKPSKGKNDYKHIVDIFNKTAHLQPPAQVGVICLMRGSRYFLNTEKFGLEPIIIPKKSKWTYPIPEKQLRNLLFEFDSNYFIKKSNSKEFREINLAFKKWAQAYWKSHLVYVKRNQGLLIIDTRSCRKKIFIKLSEMESIIYTFCETGRSMNEIREYISSLYQSDRDVQGIVESFVNKNLIININNRFLSLAVNPLETYRRHNNINIGGGMRLEELLKLKKRFGFNLSNLIFNLLNTSIIRFIGKLFILREVAYYKLIYYTAKFLSR